jgi:hypothetical protein
MDLTHSLESYFKAEVEKALEAEGLPGGTPAEHYLVRLLAAYAAQPIDQHPLALRLYQAREASPRERRAHLRAVGDTSLFVSGFWGDSLSRKLVDVEYYIEVGGSAYAELARGPRQPDGDAIPAAEPFAELAANFVRFVEVLMLVSRRTTRARSDKDLVRIYERWLRTKSRWAARRLVEAGVIPPRRPPGMLQ